MSASDLDFWAWLASDPLTVALYFVFAGIVAWQSWQAYRDGRLRSARQRLIAAAFISLGAVFAFCSVVGYGADHVARLSGPAWEHPAHLLLNVAGIALDVFSVWSRAFYLAFTAESRAEDAETRAGAAEESAQATARALLQTSGPYLAITPAGTVTGASDAFAAQIGAAPGDLTGRAYADFVHPEERGRTADALAALGPGDLLLDFPNRWPHLQTGADVHLVWDQVTPDGLVWKGRDVTAQVRSAQKAADERDAAELEAQALRRVQNDA